MAKFTFSVINELCSCDRSDKEDMKILSKGIYTTFSLAHIQVALLFEFSLAGLQDTCMMMLSYEKNLNITVTINTELRE